MARDSIHKIVRDALEKDDWIITDDPLIVLPKEEGWAIDLGAERVIVAEKGLEKIAVEIKSFSQPSIMYEFHRAVGQYVNYESALIEAESDRELFMAIPASAYDTLIESRVVRQSLSRTGIRLIIVDLDTETIERWIS